MVAIVGDINGDELYFLLGCTDINGAAAAAAAGAAAAAAEVGEEQDSEADKL